MFGAPLPSDLNAPGFAAHDFRQQFHLLRIERTQILQRLADPDQLDRDAELVGDRERDAALVGAVELGEDDARDVDGLAEQLRLTKAVLARGGVDGHERLVRRVG